MLGNDTDVDGDALVRGLVTGPSHGTLVLDATAASPTRRRPTTAAPTASPTARTTAPADSNVATVTLNVTAVDDAPVAADESYATNAAVALIPRSNGSKAI